MSDLYQKLIRPLIFKLNAENAHELVCDLLSMVENFPKLRKTVELIFSVPKEEFRICGLKFPNRVGLAAGFDKNGYFPGICSAIGLGHVEVGTVTPKPQPGNPKPRLFRLVDKDSIINRMGFNNYGAEAMSRRLKKTYPKGVRSSPLGINIGKAKNTLSENTLQDYLDSIDILHESADYFTINISSPNTPGLRDLHKEEFLHPLLKGIDERLNLISSKDNLTKIPYLLKISPDESFCSLEKIVEIALQNNAMGLIATNTTVRRPDRSLESEPGGLSGKLIEKRSTEVIKFIHRLTEGKVPIIGVGGISDVDSAIRKLDAGASLIQIYSALVYEGPFLPKKIISGLNRRNSWQS